MAHLQFSQKSFFQKTDIMHHWRALSMGLEDEQSNVLFEELRQPELTYNYFSA